MFPQAAHIICDFYIYFFFVFAIVILLGKFFAMVILGAFFCRILPMFAFCFSFFWVSEFLFLRLRTF